MRRDTHSLRYITSASTNPSSGCRKASGDRFLAIAGHPDDASAELRTLSEEAGLDLGSSLDLFDERISFIAVNGLDLAQVHYAASFGRKLDYYTGFVFEAHHRDQSSGPVVGGGRYDRLAQSLGSPTPVPAVGASVWLDRLTGDARSGSPR